MRRARRLMVGHCQRIQCRWVRTADACATNRWPERPAAGKSGAPPAGLGGGGASPSVALTHPEIKNRYRRMTASAKRPARSSPPGLREEKLGMAQFQLATACTRAPNPTTALRGAAGPAQVRAGEAQARTCGIRGLCPSCCLNNTGAAPSAMAPWLQARARAPLVSREQRGLPQCWHRHNVCSAKFTGTLVKLPRLAAGRGG